MNIYSIDSMKEYWLVWIGISILLICIVFFVWKFILPERRLSKHLKNAIKVLEEIKKSSGGKVTDLSQIDSALSVTPELAYAWGEYKETLHPQRKVEDGQNRIKSIRATTLAEIFFSEQSLVEIPLKTEFFKHFPGIITGIGIIGTFLGLITGLLTFDISEPSKVQLELKNLIHAVAHAFIVSGFAIFIAILLTFFEKNIIASILKKVSTLRQIIDSLFESGAGEEYLERLVNASETQTTQSAHIKDALVADLREILTNLTERQLQAQADQSSRMSEHVGKVIADQLGGPITDIASAVKNVSTSQGDAVNKMLTDVLAGFSSQMEDMFGGQMRGMTDLLKETSLAMRDSAEKFNILSIDMEKAGKSTVEAMSEQLHQAVSSMENRQHLMNAQMNEFVMNIKELVSESQTESSRKLQEDLSQIGKQVSLAVAQLKSQSEESAILMGERQGLLEKITVQTVDSLSEKLDSNIQVMNKYMNEFVMNIKEIESQSRSEATKNLQATLTQVGDQVGGVIADLRRQSNDSAEVMSERISRIEETTKRNIDLLSLQIKDLLSQSLATSQSLQHTVAQLGKISNEAIDKLNSGAETLYLASTDFAQAGQGVSETMKSAIIATQNIRTSSDALTNATTATREVLKDYILARTHLSEIIVELKTITENTRRDADISSKMISQIESAALKLSEAQKQAEDYLSRVNEVLLSTHKSFAENISKTLRESNRRFQEELRTAVEIVSSAVRELGDTLENIPTRRET